MKAFDVGARTRYIVDAHCGVQFAKIDGYNWKTRLRDDGNGNPPAGWPQRVEGVLSRVSKDKAVFTSDEIPQILVFHPAPDEQYTCL
jgi:hypothetical protein